MTFLQAWQTALGDTHIILFTVLRVTFIYAGLLLLLRLAGGQEFGQLSTFDLVTLLLLSNVVQNAMIGPDNSALGGLIGAAILLLLYRASTRLKFIRARLEPHPVMLIYRGQVLAHNMQRAGVSQAELEEAVRAHSIANLDEVETAVLEMNGSVSVIPKQDGARQELKQVRSQRRR